MSACDMNQKAFFMLPVALAAEHTIHQLSM
jgi:hypothetical protein